MTQEDKELLLQDLCARLPYGVYVKDIWQGTKVCKIYEIKPSYIPNITLIPISDSYYYQVYSCDIDDIKPYLRPMSSMTEEEKKDLNNVTVINCNEFEGCSTLFDETGFDWLNAHHFDYRGLIEKGLALEAPDGMYEINKK